MDILIIIMYLLGKIAGCRIGFSTIYLKEFCACVMEFCCLPKQYHGREEVGVREDDGASPGRAEGERAKAGFLNSENEGGCEDGSIKGKEWNYH